MTPPGSKDGHKALRPAGYDALIDRLGLQVIPHWHRSLIGRGAATRSERDGSRVLEIYPSRYWPGDGLGDHLEFAIKHEGVNLGILKEVFSNAPAADVTRYVRSKPHGKYARRLWFLFEFLTGQQLDLPDLKGGNYVDVLEPDQYYVRSTSRRVRRQRVNENLLGDERFCPVVRRTEALRAHEDSDLPRQCLEVIASCPPELLRRALRYLYTKEAKSSFEIEHIEPSSRRVERFMGLLKDAERADYCEKSGLLLLQNQIVDERFQDRDYRDTQNYIGESLAWGERVHFAGPRPEDLPALMEGLVHSHRAMSDDLDSAVVHAAIVSYGLVFLHPFEDGNGRIHRFLIHNILARRGFTPPGIMFPVSAVMLKRPAEYDESLEAFSRPLMELVEYTLDGEGRLSVENETVDRYRYIDMTTQAEALFRFIATSVRSELVAELDFLASYDEAKTSIQEIVDMPDRLIDLFIRFQHQNGGRVSTKKRERHFGMLEDGEVERMEEAVRTAYHWSGSE